MKNNKFEIDMCNGSIMDKLISFALPLMVSSILQLMFNAVDIIVIGRFSGSQSLAAVGSTTALIAVFTNLFIGISLGANVLAARFYAAGRHKEMSETVHTAITLALISGILMAVIGQLFARSALELMATPDDVINLSSLYLRIYFLGMPFFMLYNYGAAILRAVGDTKRPLFFLIISGSVNAILNLLLVIVFHLDVAGVAISTVIAQMISCTLVLTCLYRSDSSYQLRFSKLKIQPLYMKQIFQVGVPAGIQSTVINFSNVLLQSSVNSFGSTARYGNSYLHHPDLLLLRTDGSVPGCPARYGPFHCANDPVHCRNRGLKNSMDFPAVPAQPVTGFPVYFLPGFMDHYIYHADHLLLLCKKKSSSGIKGTFCRLK